MSALQAHRNQLSGQLSFPHSLNLQVFTSHLNNFTGAMMHTRNQQAVLTVGRTGTLPSLEYFTSLVAFTCFSNQITGRLKLPANAPNLDLLMTFANRLSCEIDHNATHGAYTLDTGRHYSTGALVAPGNQFTRPAPEWAIMASVPFQVH